MSGSWTPAHLSWVLTRYMPAHMTHPGMILGRIILSGCLLYSVAISAYDDPLAAFQDQQVIRLTFPTFIL